MISHGEVVIQLLLYKYLKRWELYPHFTFAKDDRVSFAPNYSRHTRFFLSSVQTTVHVAAYFDMKYQLTDLEKQPRLLFARKISREQDPSMILESVPKLGEQKKKTHSVKGYQVNLFTF